MQFFDTSIGDVALKRCGIALGRRAIPAGSRSDDFDSFPATQPATSVDESLDAGAAGVTAVQSPRGRQQARAVEPQLAFRLSAVHPPQSHAAAEPAGTARALDQFIPQHR
jgi:hypothetical protein